MTKQQLDYKQLEKELIIRGCNLLLQDIEMKKKIVLILFALEILCLVAIMLITYLV